MIPYLTALSRVLSGEALASALGLELPTFTSLLSGMYAPTTELLHEIKSLYGLVNYENLKYMGMDARAANANRYRLPETLEDLTNRQLELVSKIAYREGVDPNLIMEGLRQSTKDDEELVGEYQEVFVPRDFFEAVKNEILYI